MKFEFETGEIIICENENIAKLLRSDKRYKEVKNEPKKEASKKGEK